MNEPNELDQPDTPANRRSSACYGAIMQIKPSEQPPTKPPNVAIGFAGDEAEELGERIMALKLKQAVELSRYLKQVHGLVSSP